jgi:hypothetical protein
VQDSSEVSHVNPPGFDVTVYEVISAPPSENGSDQESVTEPSSTDSIVTSDGDEGTVDGVASADATEAAPVPDAFVAVTVNV